jgi:hypothetical protein
VKCSWASACCRMPAGNKEKGEEEEEEEEKEEMMQMTTDDDDNDDDDDDSCIAHSRRNDVSLMIMMMMMMMMMVVATSQNWAREGLGTFRQFPTCVSGSSMSSPRPTPPSPNKKTCSQGRWGWGTGQSGTKLQALHMCFRMQPLQSLRLQHGLHCTPVGRRFCCGCSHGWPFWRLRSAVLGAWPRWCRWSGNGRKR